MRKHDKLVLLFLEVLLVLDLVAQILQARANKTGLSVRAERDVHSHAATDGPVIAAKVTEPGSTLTPKAKANT